MPRQARLLQILTGTFLVMFPMVAKWKEFDGHRSKPFTRRVFWADLVRSTSGMATHPFVAPLLY